MERSVKIARFVSKHDTMTPTTMNAKTIRTRPELVKAVRDCYFYCRWVTIFEKQPERWPAGAAPATLIDRIVWLAPGSGSNVLETTISEENISRMPIDCEIVVYFK
ncbi:hypothetical protein YASMINEVIRUS_1575 [Yasminevirus sp. GU-2018]|uniref:Uncharacterized protein n=1 Tax=Yasminevirus sp. GU-2018 TaxID=2420051 RepID=A0A5K0UBL5_9VIRU|nr:hypothetical protein YASMINEVIRUS_1575 [Yasminevirus sp. GU-2018]